MFPALLACLHEFAQVACRANLPRTIPGSWMLAHELDCMIHVPRLKDENAAELFFGFGIGAVGGRDLSVFPREGQGGFRTLKGFAAGPVSVGSQMVVVIKACVEDGVPLALGHGLEFGFVVVAETDVFHGSSPFASGWEPAQSF